MKKRVLALLLAVFAICPLLAACSSYNYDTLEDYILLGDTSNLKVYASEIDYAVNSAYYEFFEDEIEGKTLTSTELKTGTVQVGDVVKIDYKGYLYGETTPFEGGSTYDASGNSTGGTDLQIGTGSYIRGFESGLVGYSVGDTVILNLYFPDYYASNTSLSGKQVRFEVVINSITRYNYPEMTDAEIQKQSSNAYTTVQQFKDKAAEDALKNNLWNQFYSLSKVKQYPEKELQARYDESIEEVKSNYMFLLYGGNMSSYAKAMGYSSVSDFYKALGQQAASTVKMELMTLAYVEKNNLKLDKKQMTEAMKALYNEAVAAGNYTGSYRSFVKDNGKETLKINVYTDVIMDNLISTMTKIDDSLFTGLKGTAATGIQYFKDGVPQTGWVQLDINKDGTNEDYYFNSNGYAKENVAVLVPTPEDATVSKYYKFGRFGMVASTVTGLESDGTGLIYAEDGVPKTGLQSLDKDGRISGNETYYFDPVTNRMLLGLHLLGEEFGVNAGKYYNFGETGIYRLDNTTGEYVSYGEGVNFADIDEKNGLAQGIVGDQYFDAGVRLDGFQYITVDNVQQTYYFDPANDGKMVISSFFEIEEGDDAGTYYCDDKGILVTGRTITIDEVEYTFDDSGKLVEIPADGGNGDDAGNGDGTDPQ